MFDALRLLAIVWLGLSIACPVNAADRIKLRIGALDNKADALVAKGGASQGGIDLGDLGLDDEHTSVFLDIDWWATDNWRFNVTYSRFNRSGERDVDFDFEFGDLVVPVQARVNTELDFDLYVVSAAYALINNDRGRLEVGAGLHLLDMEIEIDATTSQGTLLADEVADTLAPLPNLTLNGELNLGERWLLRAKAGWFGFDYEDYSGDLISLSGQVEFAFTEHFGAGVGYQFVDVDVEVDGSRFTEQYNLEFSGPLVYLMASF